MALRSAFKPLVTALALIALSIGTPAGAAANPKAGAACTKIGFTQSYAGKKFTCIKNGKKNVWDKGRAVSQVDPFAEFGVHASRYKALDAYADVLVKNRKVDVAPINTLLQSPSDLRVLKMVANGQFSFSVYEGIAPLGFTPLYIIGEKEEWMKANVLPKCDRIAGSIWPNGGSANCRLVEVWRGLEQRDDAFMSTLMTAQGGHEFFHLYQQELWGSHWEKVPDWLREGSASVGMVAILSRFDNRATFANYGKASSVEGSPKDQASCAFALKEWEENALSKGHGYYKNCEYGLGLVMNEFLIMKGYSLGDALETIKRIGAGETFPVAFENVYKITTAQYFEELRRYLKTLNLGW